VTIPSAPAKGNRAFDHILGEQRPSGAERFDPLIVAIGGGGCSRSGQSAPDDARRVTPRYDINRPRRSPINQHAGAATARPSSPMSQRAMSKSWIIMSRNSPRRGAHSRSGGGRIAAGYAQEFELANAAARQLIGQPRKVRIEAAVEPDHQRDAAALGHRNARSGASLSKIERFFAEDRLAAWAARLDPFGMGISRAGDERTASMAGSASTACARQTTAPWRSAEALRCVAIDTTLQQRASGWRRCSRHGSSQSARRRTGRN